ncbi:response regulator [Sinorhizobium medicae]|nr:response regulator [Sinorhizobium medicae]
MKSPIRTFIVDDHPLVIVGARTLIEASGDIVCVGEASTGAGAMTEICEAAPDVAILDVSLPDISGLELAENVITNSHVAHVVIMTDCHDRSFVQKALQIGAKGFVQKRSAAENLLLAIRSVMVGDLFFDPPTAREITASAIGRSAASPTSIGAQGLTAREQAVLRLVALGYSNKEIGAHANISVKSIETYKARATEKLNLRSRAQIVHFALTQGWMSLN